MLTFLLHVESRTAASLGVGFYTIGPCGEECLGPIGQVRGLSRFEKCCFCSFLGYDSMLAHKPRVCFFVSVGRSVVA